MRRSSQSNVGGGYNKPPPGPLSHGPNRVRLHTPENNAPILKDRFGSPRERSPSLGSVLPISPSHIMTSREKSPNPTSQDLHDCLMCLSAYIQSLNTVCGTACRLAQCLSQVGSENVDVHGTNNQMPQILKEAAEIWEGIARVMGVTSTGVKTQMVQLLQDVQKRNTMDPNDQNQQQEVSRIVKLMLSTFLNLHCQFSRIVFEKFSGMLQHLKDENGAGSNGFYPEGARTQCAGGGVRSQASPNVSPHRPTPSPPNTGMQYSPFGSANTSPHQLMHQQLFFQQQQQQQMLLQQQLMQMTQQQMVHMNSKSEGVKEDPTSRHSSGGSSLGYASLSGGWVPSSANSQQQQQPSSPNFNTLSPGVLSTYSGMSSGDWSTDAISRRWSMGAEDGWQEKNNSLSPFSLMANRRWSVPETTEHDANAAFRAIPPFYSHCNVQDPTFSLGGKTSQSWTGTKSSLHPLSRENSSTRSPSHSRSVTPEQKRPSIISNEELEDVIDLLSLPLSPSSRKSSKSSVSSVTSLGPISPHRRESDSSKILHHRIPEVHQEPSEGPPPDPPDLAGTSWPSTGTDRKSSLSKSEAESTDEGHQISTPLWPPTENVPGVTLTECIGQEGNEPSNCWTGNGSCASQEEDSFMKERASWLNSSFARMGIMDDLVLSGQPSLGPEKEGWTPTFRRHSTDAPFFLTQSQLATCGAKTRSFENLSKMVDLSEDGKVSPGVEGLLCLGSLNAPFSSGNAQFSLFTST